MYFGGTGAAGLHHLLWEIVGNVIDLHLSQLATTLLVEITPDAWVTVRDDGPGIRPSILTRACTELHAGATFDGHLPHVHVTSSLRGVGVASVNAVSTEFEIETTFEGVRYRQAFACGNEVSPIVALGASTVEGTTVRFHPDPQIFTTLAFDACAIRDRLQELAWLNPLLRVFFQGERISGRGGLLGWATSLASQRAEPLAVFSTRSVVDRISTDIALLWGGGVAPVIHSFVNMGRSVGGTHVDGLWEGLARCAKALGAKSSAKAAVTERMSSNLIAIVHVGLYHPAFAGPTKEQLTSPEAGAAVAETLAADLPAMIPRNTALRDLFAVRLGARTPKASKRKRT